MLSKMALVIYGRCHPERCDSGVCCAAKSCRRKLLWQEAPGETPMANPALCRACGDCVQACPSKAIEITIL